MRLAQELRASLQGFLARGMIEVRENGERVTLPAPPCWEVRGPQGKPLLHMWSDKWNVTRRVLGITNQSEDCVSLAVERFGRKKAERFELVRLEYVRNAKALSREDFVRHLRRILAEQFPDESVEKLSIAADLEHSLSSVYARGISQHGSTQIAFLAVPEGESPDTIQGSLTYALLWLDRARQIAGRAKLSTLRLILPKGRSAMLTERVKAIDTKWTIQIYEQDQLREVLERVDISDSGNVSSWLAVKPDKGALLERSRTGLAPVIALAPEAIRIHVLPHTQEVFLHFRGIPFLRWQDGRRYLGSDGIWEELVDGSESSLQQLILNLENFRNPSTSNTRHPLYRMQPERWMQSLVMDDISRVDVALDSSCVYDQVFLQVTKQHGIVDLLGITRAGRLAILELKATENPDLPLQAAAYWLRILRHLKQGDFARYGYFPGRELQTAPPLVYLIAPALRFHPTTDTLLRYFTPEMEVIRVGLSETWRHGIRVMLRH
jgi:hypothetical protein